MVHWQECSVHTFAVKKQKGLINLYCNLIAQCLTVFIDNHRAHIEKDILVKKYITVQYFWVGRNIRNSQAKHKRMVFRKADY